MTSLTAAPVEPHQPEGAPMPGKGTTRTCTRCQDANGVPTGIVHGGECFLCRGTGSYTRETVDAATRAAGRRRAEAIGILRAAGISYRATTARIHLEETAPERHARLVDSVLAGRVADVLAALTAYADQNCL